MYPTWRSFHRNLSSNLSIRRSFHRKDLRMKCSHPIKSPVYGKSTVYYKARYTAAHIGTYWNTSLYIGTHWYPLAHIGTHWHILVHMLCDMFLPNASFLLLFASLVYWQVKCRILYVNANKKTVGVSLQETTVLHKTATFGHWSVGDVIDDAAVFRVDQKMGLFLNLSDGILGFTHVSFIN